MSSSPKSLSSLLSAVLLFAFAHAFAGEPGTVTENEDEIRIVTPELEAAVRKKGYVTGIAAGSLLDKKTGSRDLGYGLDIVDWIMEAGSDEAYRDKLPGDLPYVFGNAWHGKRPKGLSGRSGVGEFSVWGCLSRLLVCVALRFVPGTPDGGVPEMS